MGMGEPLLNLPNVERAYHVLNKDLRIGGGSITISTVGEGCNRVGTGRERGGAQTRAAGEAKGRKGLARERKAPALCVRCEECYLLGQVRC